MSPWKLGDPNEPTVKIDLRLPKSLKDWASTQPEGGSELIRKLLARERRRRERLAAQGR